MRIWQNLKINVKILATLVPVMISIFVIIATNYGSSRHTSFLSAERLTRTILTEGANELNGHLNSQKGQFATWVADDIYGLSVEFETTDELGSQFTDMMNTAPGFSALVLVDNGGKILQSVPSDLVDFQLTNQAAISSEEGVSALAFQDPLLKKVGNDLGQSLALTFPGRDSDGNVNCYLVGVLDWAYMQNATFSVQVSLAENGFPGAMVELVSLKQNLILGHSEATNAGQKFAPETEVATWLADNSTAGHSLDTAGDAGKLVQLWAGVLDAADLMAGAGREVANQDLRLMSSVPESDILTAANRTIRSSLVIAGASCLILTFLILLLARMIANPIKKSVEFAESIAAGDLSRRPELNTEDEVGQLATAMDTMVNSLEAKAKLAEAIAGGDLSHHVTLSGPDDTLGFSLQKMTKNLNQILQQVGSEANEMDSGSDQIAIANRGLSQNSMQQASALEEITSSMTEINEQTRTNAKNATEANEKAEKVRKAADDGAGHMEAMTQAMAEISASSQEISKIIKVIDDIAFQTNLLALNAAVEAARAGVHGKGFAVVAEEVRNLAGRSIKAAQETSQFIEGSTQKVETGSRISTETAEALGLIVDSVGEVTSLIGGIAVASQEQSEAIGQVNQGLEQIDNVTQNNTANAEETASAAEVLSGRATSLKKLMKQFVFEKGSEKLAPAVSQPAKRDPVRKPAVKTAPPQSQDSDWDSLAEIQLSEPEETPAH